MTSIRSLKRRLDELAPPPEDTSWLRYTAAYHRIFEESEQVQRDYSREISLLIYESIGFTRDEVDMEWLEEAITQDLSTERLRGTKWEQFVTDWSKPPWAQPPVQ